MLLLPGCDNDDEADRQQISFVSGKQSFMIFLCVIGKTLQLKAISLENA